QRREIAEVGERGDPVERRLQRRRAARVDARFIHAAGVVVADLLRVRVARLRRVLEDLAETGFVLLLQPFGDAPRGAIGRDWLVLRPPAAGVGIEVGAGIGAAIEQGEIETGLGARARL